MESHDISMETSRTYIYPNGDAYTIQKPLELKLTEDGGHRIVDKKTAHIIRRGWVAITIPKECLVF